MRRFRKAYGTVAWTFPRQARLKLGHGRRRQRDGGFGSEQKESKRLLEVEAHNAIRVIEVANRDVLTDVQIKIAAALGQHEGAGQRRGPNDVILDELLDVSQNRVPIVGGLRESRVGISTKQDRIRPVDADETQLAQGLRNNVRILTHIGGQCDDRVAGALPDAADARSGVALKDNAVLCVGDPLGSVLRWLPIGIVRTAFYVVDLLAIKLERDPELNQRLHLALTREDVVARCSDRLKMTRADRGEANAPGPVHVDDAPSGEKAL